MTDNEINIKAFEFVGKLKIIREKTRPTKKEGSFAEVPEIDLSDKLVKDSPFIHRTLEHDNTNSKISISINDTEYGFDDNLYSKYFDFIYELSNEKNLTKIVSVEFIEEKVLLWIINVYQNSKANNELLNFLTDEIEKSVEERIFYFPILNLNINQPFKIGDVEIIYFKKEFLDSIWESSENDGTQTKENFDFIFRKYQGRVFASIKVKAESKKAKEIAFDHCSYSVDILKMFTPTVIFPLRKCYIDLEEKININYQSDSFSQSVNDKTKISISTSAKNDPIFLDETFWNLANESGFKEFSEFIKIRKEENELYRLIKQSFVFYSRAISTNDLHFRVAQLITIAESLLLEDDLKSGMGEKCKSRFSSILFPNDKKSALLFINELTEIYQIRHKIIHKAIRLRIDLKKLSIFQLTIIELFRQLIKLEKDINNKLDLIKYLDKKINGSA